MDTKSAFYRIYVYSDMEAERMKKNSPYSLPKVYVRGIAKDYTSVYRCNDDIPSDGRKVTSGDMRTIKTIERKPLQ